MIASARFVIALVCLALSATLSSAQTTVFFFAQSPNNTYPATCTTGSLSCTANATTGGYACLGGTLPGGTHYYYPTATSYTFNASLITGQPAVLCEQYYADFQLPLTTGGLNVQYGLTSQPTCVNYRVRNATTGVITADPDAVDAYPLIFNYSTTATAQPTCPTPNISASSTAATVYFTYLGLSGSASSTICGSGSLNCQSYGNNQYYCTSLVGGTHYMYNSSTASLMTTQLTSETECNGFGDGYLPLSYEGISFAGTFSSAYNCISWYGTKSSSGGYDFYTSGSVNVYKSYGGTQSFSYSTAATTAVQACAAYIPALTGSNTTSSSGGAVGPTTVGYVSSSSTGSNTGAAAATSQASTLLLLATVIAALVMSL